jgi:hypothetical protein
MPPALFCNSCNEIPRPTIRTRLLWPGRPLSPRTPPRIEVRTTIKAGPLVEARPTIPHPALTMGRIAPIIMFCGLQIVAAGCVTPCVVAATIAFRRHLSEQAIVYRRSQWQTSYRLSWYRQARASQGEWQSPEKSNCKAIPNLHVALSCCRLTKSGSNWIQSESWHGTAPLFGNASMEQGPKSNLEDENLHALFACAILDCRVRPLAGSQSGVQYPFTIYKDCRPGDREPESSPSRPPKRPTVATHNQEYFGACASDA